MANIWALPNDQNVSSRKNRKRERKRFVDSLESNTSRTCHLSQNSRVSIPASTPLFIPTSFAKNTETIQLNKTEKEMSLTLSLTVTTPRFSQLHHLTSSPILKFKPNSPLSFPRASSSMSTTSLSHLTVDQDLPPNYGDWLPKPELHLRRRAGILLHPTSFQSPYGIGDLGIEAFRFIDWLHRTGCSLWQVLPLVPPGRKANEEGSPYSGQVLSFVLDLFNIIEFHFNSIRQCGFECWSLRMRIVVTRFWFLLKSLLRMDCWRNTSFQNQCKSFYMSKRFSFQLFPFWCSSYSFY